MLADQARQFLDLVELRRRGLRLSLTARREKSASIAMRVAVSSRDDFPVLPPIIRATAAVRRALAGHMTGRLELGGDVAQ